MALTFWRKARKSGNGDCEYYRSLLARFAAAMGAETEVRRSSRSAFWRARGAQEERTWVNLVLSRKKNRGVIMFGQAVPSGANPYKAAVETFCAYNRNGLKIKYIAEKLPSAAKCSSASELDIVLSAGGM